MFNNDLSVAIHGFEAPSRRLEPAGICYEVRLIRDLLTLGHCTLPVYKNRHPENGYSSSKGGEDNSEISDLRKHLFDADNEKYEKYLFKIDPNDTKNQDHYKVLGLSKLRWQATLEEIRFCYRQKVLKHHPDKKTHRGIKIESEEYFTCIVKAYEQIGMSEAKRQAFDSVDHKFNDAIPNEKSITPENFYNELAPVFDLNSRWSNVQPVPKLGTLSSTRSDIEKFYDFWFNFSSWREFSYLDEEDKQRGEDRYERREMEKMNKAERERRRKEEGRRIRRLVDMAYSKDPRIIKFRKDDQMEKEKVKDEKKKVQRERQEALDRERQKQEDEERRIQEEEDQRVKQEKEKEKKEREINKKAAAVQRRRLKKMADEAGHWTEDPREKLHEMERIERICILLGTDELKDLCNQLGELSCEDDVRDVLSHAEKQTKFSTKCVEDKEKENEKGASVVWASDEIQLLIKASNTYPPGTVERWIQIADYINEHRKDKSAPLKNEKQVIKQCKAVQTMSVKLPVQAQNQLGTTLPDEDNWSATEQKALEEAIKKFPTSDPERWEKISSEVASKSKKACIRRFKYLVQMVKNKK